MLLNQQGNGTIPQPSNNLFNNPLNQSMLFGQTKPFLNPPAPSN